MSSALSFQWHLCDVFKVTYLISFDTIDYHLHYLHSASLPTVFKQEKKKNKRDFFFFPSLILHFVAAFQTHDSRGFILIFILFVHPVSAQLSCMSCWLLFLLPQQITTDFTFMCFFFKLTFFFFFRKIFTCVAHSSDEWGVFILCASCALSFFLFSFFFFFYTTKS